MQTKLTLLTLFLMSCLLCGGAAEKNTEIKLLYTADLGSVYYPRYQEEQPPVKSLEKAIKKAVVDDEYAWVDLGNFSGLSTINETDYRLRPLRLFREVKGTAAQLGYQELMQGSYILSQWQQWLGAESLLTPLEIKHPNFSPAPRWKLVEHQGVKLGLIPALDYSIAGFTAHYVTAPKSLEESLKDTAKELSGKTDLNILLSQLPPEPLQELLAKNLLPIQLVLQRYTQGENRDAEKAERAEEKDGRLYCYVGPPGSLHRLRLQVDTEKGEILEHSLKVERPVTVQDEIDFYTLCQERKGGKPKLPESLLPEIGGEITAPEQLRQYGFDFDEATVEVSTARSLDVWLANEQVIAYRLYRGRSYLGRLYYMQHRPALGASEGQFFILIKSKKIVGFGVRRNPYLLSASPEIFELKEEVRDKKASQLRIDTSRRVGIEWLFRTLEQDLKLVLEIDRRF